MLTRIAENVYWIGRFVERTEDLARLVSSYHYSATQLGWLETHTGIDDLIAVLGEPRGGAATFTQACAWWVTDEGNPSSVVSCVRAARENARRAREVLSLEVWETINQTMSWVERARSRGAGYAEIAAGIVEHTRATIGATETAMPRDETWEVLRLGLMIERAAMTLRAILIGAQTGERLVDADPLALHMWTVTLRATSALDAYRRTTTAMPNAGDVSDLLVRSMTCPRSVLFAVREATPLVRFGGPAASALDRLREIAKGPSGVPSDGALAARAERLLRSCDETHKAIVSEWRGWREE